MRPFETLVLLALFLTLSSFLINVARRPRWMTFLPSLALPLVLLHLLLEDCRLPMIPAYALTLVLFLSAIRHLWRRRPPQEVPSRGRRTLSNIAILLGWLFFVPAAVLPAAVPVFQLPEPTGPYPVGSTHLYFIDDTRSEVFTPDPDDSRQIWARIWYPATVPADQEAVSYMDEGAARALATWWGLPSFILDDLVLVKTHAYSDASLAPSATPFPLIFFNHGYQVAPHQYTALMEDLASHGYVVFNVGHAYETPFFTKPDGELIPFDPQNRRRQLTIREGSDLERERILYEFPKTTSWQERDTLYKELFKLSPHNNESVRIWATDVSSLITHLHTLNSSAGLFAGRLDPDRIGVAGHSFGGAAAGQASLTDSRIKAGMNIDGLQNGDLAQHDLTIPFMFLASHTKPFSDEDGVRLADPFYERSESAAYIVLIKGTTHVGLSDFPLMGFLVNGILSGELAPRRCSTILGTYVRAFFDKHLKGKDAPLLDGQSSDFPEVVLWSRNQ
jgi:predicted dienelactone hydrolase